MPTLYVANCNPRQRFVLLYRLPEARMNAQPVERTIGPMAILPIPNLTDPEAAAIEDQLARYGAREASERITGEMKVERLYSRSPIKDERVRQVLGFNVGLMEDEGRERLQQTAAALSSRAKEVMLENGVRGNLEALELSTQEDSDDPKIALGARVVEAEDDKAKFEHTRRNRRRK